MVSSFGFLTETDGVEAVPPGEDHRVPPSWRVEFHLDRAPKMPEQSRTSFPSHHNDIPAHHVPPSPEIPFSASALR